MSDGAIVLVGSAGLLVAATVSYLVLGAAADARSTDSTRRRKHVIGMFTAAMFDGSGARLEELIRRHALERETLVEIVSGLGVDLGADGRQQLRDALANQRTERLFRRLGRARRWTRRVEAARLCGMIGTARQRIRLLTDRHRAVRIAALASLAPDEVAAHADLVAQALLDPDPDVRMTAASVLPTAGTRASQPLVSVLEQTGADREAALLAAGRLQDRALLRALYRHARADHASNRVLAARALSQQNPVDSEPVLASLLADDDPRVRAAAADGLGRLGHHSSLLALRGLLNDPNWTVQRAAERALLGLGPGGGLVLRQQARRRAELEAADDRRDGVPLPVGRGERSSP